MAWEQEREKAEVNHAHHEVPLACLVRVLLVSRFHGPSPPLNAPTQSQNHPHHAPPYLSMPGTEPLNKVPYKPRRLPPPSHHPIKPRRGRPARSYCSQRRDGTHRITSHRTRRDAPEQARRSNGRVVVLIVRMDT